MAPADQKRNAYRAARYVISAHQLRQLGADDGYEVAFAGRSNAGKSSAINTLTGQKSLARTSKTPGRTQALNYFALGPAALPPQAFLVDTPGVGNVKVITLTASANQRVQERTALVTVSSPGLQPETLTVTQSAGAPVLSISQDKIFLSSTGGSAATVIVTSNTPWKLKCPEPWITASMETGDGFRQVQFTALENTGSSERKAEIVITVAGLPPKVINIIQRVK